MTHLLGEGPTRVLIILVLLTVVIFAAVTLKILLVPLVAAGFVSYLLDP